MSKRRGIEPRVEGFESKMVPSHLTPHHAAELTQAVTTATGIAGTINATATVRYNASTGLNLILINGRGTLSPYGRSVGVAIVVAQVRTPTGVSESGGIFFLTPRGPQLAILTPVSIPTFTPGGFTLPVVARYTTVPGVGTPFGTTGTVSAVTNGATTHLIFS